MNTGFYQIITELNTRLKAEGFLIVSFGEEPDYANKKNIVTPAAHISPLFYDLNQNARTGNATNSLTIEIFAYEKLTLYKNNEDQIQEADGNIYGNTSLFDCIHTIERMINGFYSKIANRTIQLESGFMRVAAGGSFQIVQSEGLDDVAGLLGQIRINYDMTQSVC